VAKEFAELGDAAPGGVLNHHAVAGGTGITARATVNVGDQAIFGQFFDVRAEQLLRGGGLFPARVMAEGHGGIW
jgi:hypothetical protein